MMPMMTFAQFVSSGGQTIVPTPSPALVSSMSRVFSSSGGSYYTAQPSSKIPSENLIKDDSRNIGNQYCHLKSLKFVKTNNMPSMKIRLNTTDYFEHMTKNINMDEFGGALQEFISNWIEEHQGFTDNDYVVEKRAKRLENI